MNRGCGNGKERAFHRRSKGRPCREIWHQKEVRAKSILGKGIAFAKARILKERGIFKKQKTADCGWGLECGVGR